ncbi:MAG: 16S rRNA (cytosine(967)-C(5))-methyltransferase RsmB [Deltaproteobacteria bacterium]|nr:16S rRNA (cytosine(967)-C(5))-methyltransferase RsmB [Deltaproteobacteria bacterium]
MKRARDVALTVLGRVEEDRAFAAAALDAELDRLKDPRDRALATQLALGVLRRQSWLDRLLEDASTKGLQRIDPTIRRILRIGAFQLAFLERVPARAAVSEAVAQAKRSRAPGLAGMVNGLLRNLASRDRDALRPSVEADGAAIDELAARLGQRRWLLERLVDAFGRQRAVAIAASFNRPSRRTLRINTNRALRDDVLAAIGESGSAAKLSPLAIDVKDPEAARRLEAEGSAVYQDEGAQLVVLAADPGPATRILDACAGRGGKTGALAAAAGRAEVVAVDRQPSKLERLQFELGRQGLSATTVEADLTGDATELVGPFDRVLLDAPCSGTGTLGRRPEIRWRLEPADVNQLVDVQRQMLDRVAELVADGGRLVYAVCSLLPEESEGHLDRFLDRHPEFSLTADPPTAWPSAVPWNNGRVLVDPSQTRTDGYQMLCLTRS